MANLKQLRNRIASVRSMQRIASAMKMVAAAKLRRAQQNAQAARPYAERMERMLRELAAGVSPQGAPALLTGSGRADTHLFVVVTSDRGLCGGFNAALARDVRRRVAEVERKGGQARLLIVGRKGRSMLRRDYGERILDVFEDLAKPAPDFSGAEKLRDRIAGLFADGAFDICTVIYSKFVSALKQDVTPLQLIPFAPADGDGNGKGGADAAPPKAAAGALYEYEPSEGEILESLLPRNLSVQLFRALLESFASEQGARMTAMDSASRNAGEMIDRLSIQYNRSRQAQITKELIEIVSGAEAL